MAEDQKRTASSQDSEELIAGFAGDPRPRPRPSNPIWRNVEVNAPREETVVTGKGGGIQRINDDAVINISVRELRGNELGALADPNKLPGLMERAVARKSEEDKAAYNMTTAEMRDHARRTGYFDSPSHVAWSEAAEARTGGRIPAEWWRNFDPYGGTNGNGPDILAGGLYPHPLSRIGMAHDTDWSLGRHFQAGPMRALYGANYDSDTLGKYGLDPFNPIKPGVNDIYTNGHPDWNVRYLDRPQNRQAGIDGELGPQQQEVARSGNSTLLEGNSALNRHFEQALKGANGDKDAAALALQTMSQSPGYNPNADINVVQGKNGGLIVSQGEGATAINLPVPQAKAGDFERVAAQMAQLPQTTQVAQQQDQPERTRTM